MSEYAEPRSALVGRDGGRPVVAGYDGSPASKHALAYAAGLARRGDHWLVVVHVSRLGGMTPVSLTLATLDWLYAELAEVDLSGLDVEIIWRTGDPAGEILKLTRERHADAIVIGASRRPRNVKSLPTRLARHALCPAVVVP